MKLVHTTRGFEAVTLPHASGNEDRVLTIGRVPVLVANDHAEKYQEAAAAAGVALTVSEGPEGSDEQDEAPGRPQGQVPDLSRGIAAITGTGDPVPTTTPGTAGDTQED